MTGLVRKATLLSGALLLVASAAVAGVPSAANSSLPAGIQLVGTQGGIVDVKGEAVVTVRDAGNNPVINSTVEILMGDCATDANSDLNLDDVQPFPNQSFNCVGRVVSALTNASGQATFRIVGGASALPGNNIGLVAGCAQIRADGQMLTVTDMIVGAYDLNTTGGVNAADQSLFLGTLFGAYRSRADYNGSGTVTAADLSKLLSVQFAAGSGVSAALPHCF